MTHTTSNVAGQNCADGNAEDNFDKPPSGGWGYYNNGNCLRLACAFHLLLLEQSLTS